MSDRDADSLPNPRQRRPAKQEPGPESASLRSSLDAGSSFLPRPVGARGDGVVRSQQIQSHRHRASGSFLLSDPLQDQPRRSINPADARHPPFASTSRNLGTSHSTGAYSETGHGSAPSPQARARSAHTDDPRPTRPDSFSGRFQPAESSGSSLAPLDVDSTQIVNMALNLSESRRQAGRRSITQHASPKLAPLPDGASAGGGSLRQHLQQQRRASSGGGPASPGMLARGQRLASPLQSSFDTAPDGAYRYHFSQSTLARAQKAKNHLELAGQYRRLLALVPPLNTETKTPGREYNPLQYVRNRKVRARERRAIDSEAQGFADAGRVTEWVDEVDSQARDDRKWTGLPPFSPADEALANASPAGSSRASAGPKPKRPRIDWVIDPADMLADLYWLEQGDHKMLVEDRHWRRVFPQDPRFYQQALPPDAAAKKKDDGHPEPPADTASTEGEHVLGGARERAHQKLQALKGLHGHHHRHSSSLLHGRRGSVSDSSGTESDRRRRPRNRTIGSSDQDVLEKQMLDMIAREREEAHRPSDKAPRLDTTASPTTTHKDAIAEASETDGSRSRPQVTSPRRPGRESLEVPPPGFSRRPSLDYDSSMPNSPDLRPTRTGPFVPAIGMDLTPSTSRRSSPSRKPFAKVKHMFHDRNRDRVADTKDDSPESDAAVRTTAQSDAAVRRTATKPRPSLEQDSRASVERRRSSQSPPRKTASGGAERKGHRSRGSFRYRVDEPGSGIRGLLKGPRIDSVLRTGAHKVGDLLWKKESEDGPSSSDAEPEERKNGRTYLDAMPEFVSMSDSHLSSTTALADDPTPRPPSRRSPRFDRLKPPRIDVQTAVPNTAAKPVLQHPDSDASDAESFKSSTLIDGVRAADARLNAVLSQKQSQQPDEKQRWPVSDRRTWTAASSRLSRPEIARLRALMLSSGIVAMEIDRRAKRRQRGISADPPSQAEAYAVAARVLAASVRETSGGLRASAEAFASGTSPALRSRAEALRQRARGRSELTRAAADEADEVGRDLVGGRRLRVKATVDTIEKLLRRRRRRFRWLRRAGWLALEWVLVGLMWYVWFVVMIARVFLGVGKGVVRGVRWLLWM